MRCMSLNIRFMTDLNPTIPIATRVRDPRSKPLCWFKLRGFLENLEKLLGTVHTVSLRTAYFLHDALLFQLTNGSHYRVVRKAKALLSPTRRHERICPQQIHDLYGNLCVRITGEFTVPAFQQCVGSFGAT